MPQIRSIQKLITPQKTNKGDGIRYLESDLQNSNVGTCGGPRSANEILQKAQIHQEYLYDNRWTWCDGLVSSR